MTNYNPTANTQQKPQNFQPGQKPQPEIKDKDLQKGNMVDRKGVKEEACGDKGSCSTK